MPRSHLYQISSGLPQGQSNSSANTALMWVPAASEPPNPPIPFHTFLLKIASRCNLDCDYCYMYHLADQSWRRRPKLMDNRVLEKTVYRIREHVDRNELTDVSIIFHGGEPLLAGREWFAQATKLASLYLSPQCKIRFGIQTNGTLLNQSFLDLFLDRNIKISLSLDGDRAINDAHRLYRDGRSSYDAVEKALDLLRRPKWRPLFGGILAVINLQADPLNAYRHLASFAPPSLDFLLPDGNHAHPPEGKNSTLKTTPYADWLIPIFDEWYDRSKGPPVMRYFEQIIELLLGAKSSLESIGLSQVDLIVVETDGEIEAVDSLKSTFNGASSLKASVFDNSFDDVLSHPAIYSRQIGSFALCSTCQTCELMSVCGGGYQPHRYSNTSGFLNPSVYCADLEKLIKHIAFRLRKDLLNIAGPKT